MKDAYTGQGRGRVTEAGFNPTIVLLLRRGWFLPGSALFGIRDGENVEITFLSPEEDVFLTDF